MQSYIKSNFILAEKYAWENITAWLVTKKNI